MPQFTRKQLETAPWRDWQEVKVYDSLFLLPTRKKHDSGYHLIAIVGAIGDQLETAASCDDICWIHPEPVTRESHFAMRTDMTWPGGVVHCWGWNTKFRVGAALSSTDVEVIYVPKEKP